MSVREIYIKRIDPCRIYTIGEVCRILERSRGAIINHINSGRLPAEKIYGSNRIEIAGSDIVLFLESYMSTAL